ncbi:MAG: hypothetical protein JWR26_1554 [Pedosphaera sp.]|nr:hypothetical protein [Pedosphaera sp.]
MSEPAPNRKSRRGFGKPLLFGLSTLLVIGIVTIELHHRPEAMHKGRPVREWVELALAERPSMGETNARHAVVEIGSPAVPYLIEALTSKNHGVIHQRVEWLRWHLPERLRWAALEYCVSRHVAAGWLLSDMGEAGRPAVPALIRCLKQCPELHYVNSSELLDDLGNLGSATNEALPYFTELANKPNSSFRLRAACYAYYMTGKTNLVAAVFCNAGRERPKEFLFSRELFWLRDDSELNQHFVPILIHCLSDARLDDSDRSAAIYELEYRGPGALAALPTLAGLIFNSRSQEVHRAILHALPRIVGIAKEHLGVWAQQSEQLEYVTKPQKMAQAASQ